MPEPTSGSTDLAAARRLLGEVERAGGCLHPVRLFGANVDLRTGEVREGTVGIACKGRRAVVCPACAARYRSDAWHLVAAGLRGGKGVPESVVDHPILFVTLTAPSFGPVHAHRESPCRPRRSRPSCPHGLPLSCFTTHGCTDPVPGEPLCPACFAYDDAILWNAALGRLWDRTAALVRHDIAHQGGKTQRGARNSVRLSYVKVAEFQRRGLVHLHVVVRADGPTGPADPPPQWVDQPLLEAAVRAGARGATVRTPLGGPVVWGTQVDVAVIGDSDHDSASSVATYLAGYSVKGSEATGVLARRIRSIAELDRMRLRPHVATLVRTAWDLGADPWLQDLRLRHHAHTFGYRGQFATTSRAYSTTIGNLRAARVAYGRPASEDRTGAWRYAGRGYETPDAAALAEVFFEVRPNGRQNTDTDRSVDVATPSADNGEAAR